MHMGEHDAGTLNSLTHHLHDLSERLRGVVHGLGVYVYPTGVRHPVDDRQGLLPCSGSLYGRRIVTRPIERSSSAQFLDTIPAR